MNRKTPARKIAAAAVIAAIYTVLTLVSVGTGAVQLRFSEAMCVLPAFFPEAIFGLTVGCIISNLVTGCVIWDIVFGSFATLAGAVLTYYFGKKRILASAFPIITNTLILPPVLTLFYGNGTYVYFIVTVFLSELLSCGILGQILYSYLKKFKF